MPAPQVSFPATLSPPVADIASLRPRAMLASPPGPDAPLAGLTLLLVEDSRFASDALRLMAQRAGARLRRAETLALALAHLRLYRPDVVLIDRGLPDGDGTDLVARIAAWGRGRPILLGLSGHDGAEGAMRRAGADGFLAKPLASLAQFQDSVLAHLPDRAWLMGGGQGHAAPAADPLALRDDLVTAARLLATGTAVEEGRYLAGFVAGLARAAGDPGLERLARAARTGPTALAALGLALTERLEAQRPGDLVVGRA